MRPWRSASGERAGHTLPSSDSRPRLPSFRFSSLQSSLILLTFAQHQLGARYPAWTLPGWNGLHLSPPGRTGTLDHRTLSSVRVFLGSSLPRRSLSTLYSFLFITILNISHGTNQIRMLFIMVTGQFKILTNHGKSLCPFALLEGCLCRGLTCAVSDFEEGAVGSSKSGPFFVPLYQTSSFSW